MSKGVSRRKLTDDQVSLTIDEIALLLRAVRLTNLTLEMVEIGETAPPQPKESFERKQNIPQAKPALLQLAT